MMYTKLSQIRIEGVVENPIQVIVAKKQVKKMNQKTNAAYEFLLKDGKSRIYAMAFGPEGEKLFNDLQENCKYIINGKIEAKKRNFHAKEESTSNFYLNFYEITYDLVTQPRTADKRSNLDDFKQLRQHIKKKNYGEYKIQRGQLNGGRLHRYLGLSCENCTKIIRYPRKNGKFYCSTCKKETEETQRKACILITGIKITNVAGDYIDNVVCFDNEAKSLLKMNTREFLHDDVARNFYLEIIASKRFDFTVGVLKTGILTVKGIVESEQNASGSKVFLQATSSSVDKCSLTGKENTCICTKGDSWINVDVSKILNRVVIKRSLSHFQRPITPYEYEINRKNPGFVLVIHNMEFKNEETSFREGSDLDVRNIRSFFEPLGFKMFIHNDVEEREDLEKIIREFKRTVISEKPSSTFVFVFSHGENMEVELSGSPEEIAENYFIPKKVNFYDCIVSQFSERNFPEFKGFPKIFFDCSCKVFRQTNYAGELERCKDFFTDMFICHTAFPGRPSCRYAYVGTWFIRTLIEIWMNHAYNTDLSTTMKMVQRSLQNYGRTTDADDYSQVCLWFPLEFEDFYFPI